MSPRDVRIALMPHMYAHVPQAGRLDSFARERIEAITENIKQLQMEQQMWEYILAGFKENSCSHCQGHGKIGYYPYGMEDGMRFKQCDKCGGTGNP